MENITIGGTKFTIFTRDNECYLCTGNPTGELKFSWSGEIADYICVVGATSVVSGNGTISELYNEWLKATSFYREVLGIKY